jgi:hypothetical protein
VSDHPAFAALMASPPALKQIGQLADHPALKSTRQLADWFDASPIPLRPLA